MSNLWNHLAQFEPIWTCSIDAAAFYAYQDCSHLRYFPWLFLLIMSIHGLLFFIVILFLLLAKPLPSLDLRQLARRLWLPISTLRLFWSHLPSHLYHRHLSQFDLLARRLYHLVVKKNITIFVDVTIILIRNVALATNPNAKVPATFTDSTGPSPNSSSSSAFTAADVETIVTQTGKIIETGRKVGRLFELESLHVLPQSIAAASSPNSHTIQIITILTLVEQRVGGQGTDDGTAGEETLGTSIARDGRLGEDREPTEEGEVTGEIISKNESLNRGRPRLAVHMTNMHPV
ncbi:hypothetical protein Acr_03g0012960 [Actinidia rufa]|uniref:Uncharacterized protein n=1 Tax=Actinidia rufa TaxID=165716 RepID=A0A7J0EDW9_9ERIC|nr:hypothetical protein Acr_03g0012960 [Actinidia rufa]